MPIIARCKGCKHILYDGPFHLRSGSRGINLSSPNVPRQIIKLHNGECPNCERKLEMPTAKNMRVLPAPGVDYIGKKRYESRRKHN